MSIRASLPGGAIHAPKLNPAAGVGLLKVWSKTGVSAVTVSGDRAEPIIAINFSAVFITFGFLVLVDEGTC